MFAARQVSQGPLPVLKTSLLVPLNVPSFPVRSSAPAVCKVMRETSPGYRRNAARAFLGARSQTGSLERSDAAELQEI